MRLVKEDLFRLDQVTGKKNLGEHQEPAREETLRECKTPLSAAQ